MKAAMGADLQLYLLLVLLIVIPIILFATRRSTRRRGCGAGRLPPGPWALPVIGHLHHLAGGALPHRALRDLARRHGPLMTLRLGELRAVVASSPDAARDILKTHDAAFASRPLTPMMDLAYRGADGIIFAPYGDGWRQLRKVCTLELLSARRVHSFRSIRDDEVGRLLRAVAAAASSSPVNLSEGIARYVADSTVRAIIGSRFKDRDAYLRLLQDGLKFVPGMTLPDLFPSSRLALLVSTVPGRLRRQAERMGQFVDAIIKERHESCRTSRREHQDEDLLDVLLRLQKEVDSQYPLTTQNIKNVMTEIFGAGNESSATTLQWAMAELMRNPIVMQKAQDEVRRTLADQTKVTEDSLPNLHYLHLVIKETLRLHPPAPLLLPRRCGGSPSCRVLGYDVPEGTTVIVNAWAIGTDPAHWDEPDEFTPERFEARNDGGRDFKGADFELIPFGAGRRMCPGMAFGLAHVELALAALLFHFDWRLPGDTTPEELDMTEAFGVTTRRKSDLLVVPVLRIPVPSE